MILQKRVIWNRMVNSVNTIRDLSRELHLFEIDYGEEGVKKAICELTVGQDDSIEQAALDGRLTRDNFREMRNEYWQNPRNGMPTSKQIENYFGNWKNFRIAAFEYAVKERRKNVLARW